jgi:hypothetical protein
MATRRANAPTASAMLLHAAELIDKRCHTFCCHALDRIYGDWGVHIKGDLASQKFYDEYCKASNTFWDLYSQRYAEEVDSHFWNKEYTPRRKQLRVLALLFTAQVVHHG